MSVKITLLYEDENDSIHSTTQPQQPYPDILYTLEPAIQHTTRLLRILLWKKGYTHQSLILTLIWTFFWFHSSIVSYTIPIWISLVLYYTIMDPFTTPIEQKSTTLDSFEKLTVELKELQFELSFILPSPESKDQFRHWCQSFLFVQDRRHVFTLVSLYVAWIGVLQLFTIEKIIWLHGAVLLTWHSSLFQVIRYAYHRAVYLISQVNNFKKSATVTAAVDDQALKTTINKSKKDHHLDRFYHFVVIEHQRWWLHKGGWASLLLPNERPAWSDEYLSKVPSIDQFHLPPPTTRTDNNNKTVEISWEWISDTWEIDYNHNVDKDGWEYGSWDWTSWSTKSSGLRVLTRRRHWVRNARLVKKELKTMPILINKRTSTATSSTASSFSSCSASSEDSSSFLYSTSTNSTPPPPMMKSSWSISTVSTSIVEPYFCSDEKLLHHYPTSSSMDSQLWLRR